ncbi:MAG: phosphoenolpyruvate hydrolase family protein [Candidatus Bathyarchaeia archaeon]
MVDFIPREEIIRRLLKEVNEGKPLVIAGVSLGETAKAAEDGGADLLLFYNSGRFRMAGIGSLAGLMPYANANDITVEMAREIAPVVKRVPLIGGVCATDPFRNIKKLLIELKEIGVSGVINFPTVCMIDGIFRENLEEQGFSFNVEIEMLKMASKMDMLTSSYIFNIQEAERVAGADVDIAIIHVGYRKPLLTIEQAIEKVKEISAVIKRVNDRTLIFCHGDPIVDAKTFKKVYDETDVVGFMGFTGIEREPSIKAIRSTVREFKTVKKG